MKLTIQGYELYGLYAPILLSALAVGGLMLEVAFFRKKPRAVGVFTLVGLLCTLFLQFSLHIYRINVNMNAAKAFGGQIYFDVYSVYFNYLFLIAASTAVVLSLSHKREEEQRGEYYLLLIMATVGMCLMAAANDLLIFFIGLETMSISVYVLVGIEPANDKGHEAAIKYLLLGAFASAILLFGAALVYGVTGSIGFDGIHENASGLIGAVNGAAVNFAESPLGPGMSVMGFLKALAAVLTDRVPADYLLAPGVASSYLTFMFGVTLVLVGMFFKVAAVPFHMWTPDVYQGAPTPITAFMSTGVKAAAFAILVRVMLTAFSSLWGYGPLYVIVYVLAVLTMTLGNVVAIAQTNLKRMLAYSSIAHAGYLLVGLTAVIASGQFYSMNVSNAQAMVETHVYPAASSILFYLLAYTLMNLGAFGVIGLVEREKKDGDTLAGFSGLSSRRPMLAAVMAIFMLSLAGVPPLAGFAAKFYVFQSAVYCRLYILAVIGVLNSVVSAYFYLRVLVVMYMQPESGEAMEHRGVTAAHLACVVMAAGVVVLGLLPQSAISLLTKAFDSNMINILIH